MENEILIAKREDVPNPDVNYPGVTEFADPVNRKYPIDTEVHVRAALSYFAQKENRAFYSPNEQKLIWSRIVTAAKKYNIKVTNEELSEEEIKMADKKEEILSQDVPAVVPVETKTEQLDSKSTEVKQEEKLAEAPKVEVVAEATKVAETLSVPTVAVVEPAKVVVSQEQTSAPVDKNVEVLKEELSVIKEVRNELAKAYAENTNLAKSNEQLSKELEALKIELDNHKKTAENLSTEIAAYKARDAEAEKLAYTKELEQLSEDFKSLGQTKSVEELSKLDKNVISEFKTITKLAMGKRDSEKLDAKTVPSQAVAENKPVAVAVQKKPISQQDFMKGLCNVLNTQQTTNGADSKRILHL